MNSIKQIIYYGVSIVCLKGISFLMMPFITHHLPPQIYGELNLLVSLAALLSLVLTFGLAELLFRFFNDSDKNAKQNLVVTCIWLSLAGAGFALLLAWGVYSEIVDVSFIFNSSLDVALLLISLAGGLLLSVPLCVLRLEQQAKQFMLFSVLQGVIQAAATLILLSNDMAVTGVMLSSVIASWSVAIGVIFYYRNYLHWATPRFNATHCRYMASITLSSIFLYTLNGAENWFVALMLGKNELALFFVAAQFALITSIAFEPFRLWWYPKRFKVFAANAKQAADGAVLGAEISVLIALAMMLFGPWLVELMLPLGYQESRYILPILCFTTALRTQSDLFNLGCYLQSSASSVAIINGLCACFALLCIGGLIYFFEFNGLLAALIILALVRLFAFWLVSQRLTHLPYNYQRMATCFIILIVGMVCSALQLFVLMMSVFSSFVLLLAIQNRLGKSLTTFLKLTLGGRYV